MISFVFSSWIINYLSNELLISLKRTDACILYINLWRNSFIIDLLLIPACQLISFTCTIILYVLPVT